MLSRNPFRRPFPERRFGRSVVLGHLRTGAFVFVALLFLFPPLLALAYGAVTFLIALLYSYGTERLGVRRTGPRWTMARWTLDQAILLLFVSTACFLLYNATVEWSVLNLRVLLYITLPTVLVGLLPIVFSGIALQLRAEQDHQRTASRMQVYALGGGAGAENDPDATMLARRNGPDSLQLITASSSQEVKRSLEELAPELREQGLVRCHRDYFVDTKRIVAVSADAQGLRLRLRGVEESVPVTKEYFREIS